MRRACPPRASRAGRGSRWPPRKPTRAPAGLGLEGPLDDLPVGDRVGVLGRRAAQALLQALAQARGTGVVVLMAVSPRSATTRSRRRERRSRPALRATPITSPNAPARPAATPASASSTTTARAGGTAEAARKPRGSRRGPACRAGPSSSDVVAVDGERRRGRRCPRRAGPRGALALEETTAVRTLARRSCITHATEPGNASTPPSSSARSTRACLRSAMASTSPSTPRGGEEVAHAVVAGLAVDVREVVGLAERLLRLPGPGAPVEERPVEDPLPAARVQGGRRGQHAVEVEEDRVVGGGHDALPRRRPRGRRRAGARRRRGPAGAG